MRKLVSLLAAVVMLLVSVEASAAFHLMKIVQVYASPNGSYVQLQMYAAGQNQVAGHAIKVYDATGKEIAGAGVTMNNAVSSGTNQSTILIGTSSVPGLFGLANDFALPMNLNQAGGKVCFDAIDCFAWGNYAPVAPDVTVVGTPFAALTNASAATLTVNGGTNTTGLDAADDTNNSAADFAAQAPAPKNNAGVTGALGDAGASSSSGGAADSGTSGGVDSGPSGAVDSGASTSSSSGVSTKPSDPSTSSSSGSSSTSGSAAAPPASGGGSDDGGCSVVSSDVSFGGVVLALGTAIALLSRRRRKRS